MISTGEMLCRFLGQLRCNPALDLWVQGSWYPYQLAGLMQRWRPLAPVLQHLCKWTFWPVDCRRIWGTRCPIVRSRLGLMD